MSGSTFTTGLPASAASLNALVATSNAAQATANAAQASVASFPTPMPIAGGTFTGAVTLAGAPTLPNHAATKAYSDGQAALYMPLAGGTFSGLVALSGPPTSANHATTKAYVDGQVAAGGGGAAGALPLAGGTMTGELFMGGQPLAYDSVATAFTQWDAANSRVVHTGNFYRFGVLGESFDIKPYAASLAAPNFLNLTVNATHVTDQAIDNTSVLVTHTGGSGSLYSRRLFTTYTATSPTQSLWSDFVSVSSSANNNTLSVVGQYVQSVRTAVQSGGTIGCAQWGTVIELRSQTNLPSSQDGILQTVEFDMFCGGLDDKPGRTIVSMVVGRNVAGDAAPQVSNGISLFPMAGSIGTGASVGRAYSANIGFYQSVFDTRSATQLTGANAIWLASGHTLAMDTPGTRTLAADVTDGELRYSVAGVPIYGIRDDGSTSDGRFRNMLRNPVFSVLQAGVGPWTTGSGASFAIVDAWAYVGTSGGTRTVSVQALIDADRTAIGQQAASYALSYQFVGGTGSADREVITQVVPNVRLMAAKTVTVSFWAKAAAGAPNVGVEFVQNFGTGGSPSASVNAINGTVQVLSTTWKRYSLQVAIPTAAGAVVGSNNDSNQTLNLWLSQGASFATRGGVIGVQSATILFWGIQVERNLFPSPVEYRPDDVELGLVNTPIHLLTTGGTMTGTLALSGAPTLPLQAATKGYVDAAVIAGGAPTGATITSGATATFSGTQTFLFINKGTGSATAVTLPAVPIPWQPYVVKDMKGDAATNNITVTGSANIDNLASFVMNQNMQSTSFVSNGSVWGVV